MISLNIGKLQMSLEQLKAIRKRVRDDANGAFRQKLYYLLEVAAKVSPQFSGEFASNWGFEVDGKPFAFRPWTGSPNMQPVTRENGRVEYVVASKAGDPEAVERSLARGRGTLQNVTYLSKVHLVNATELYTDGTYMYGPDGKVHLRPENLIPGNVRIEAYIEARAREAGISK